MGKPKYRGIDRKIRNLATTGIHHGRPEQGREALGRFFTKRLRQAETRADKGDLIALMQWEMICDELSMLHLI